MGDSIPQNGQLIMYTIAPRSFQRVLVNGACARNITAVPAGMDVSIVFSVPSSIGTRGALLAVAASSIQSPPKAFSGTNLLSRVTSGRTERTKELKMFMTLFVVLLVMWLLGFFASHVAGGLIHFLLIIALISLVMHFFRGRSAA